MSEKITILIADENVQLLRELQSKIILRTTSKCSFSKIVNIVVEYGINPKRLDEKLMYIVNDFENESQNTWSKL